MRIKKTNRGFELIEFQDYNGEACSLQQSSLAIYVKPGTSAIWLGTEPNRMHLTEKQLLKLLPHLKSWAETGSFKP